MNLNSYPVARFLFCQSERNSWLARFGKTLISLRAFFRLTVCFLWSESVDEFVNQKTSPFVRFIFTHRKIQANQNASLQGTQEQPPPSHLSDVYRVCSRKYTHKAEPVFFTGVDHGERKSQCNFTWSLPILWPVITSRNTSYIPECKTHCVTDAIQLKLMVYN